MVLFHSLGQDAVEKCVRFLLLVVQLAGSLSDEIFEVLRVLFEHLHHVVHHVDRPAAMEANTAVLWGCQKFDPISELPRSRLKWWTSFKCELRGWTPTPSLYTDLPPLMIFITFLTRSKLGLLVGSSSQHSSIRSCQRLLHESRGTSGRYGGDCPAVTRRTISAAQECSNSRTHPRIKSTVAVTPWSMSRTSGLNRTSGFFGGRACRLGNCILCVLGFVTRFNFRTLRIEMSELKGERSISENNFLHDDAEGISIATGRANDELLFPSCFYNFWSRPQVS